MYHKKNNHSQNHHVQNQLDNRSYSTIKPTIFATYNMKVGVWPAILELFDFLESKIDPDYTPKFSPIWKKGKQQPLDGI